MKQRRRKNLRLFFMPFSHFMVSIRMTEDEKEKVKEFLKRLRGQI